jgi:hypothetical protein
MGSSFHESFSQNVQSTFSLMGIERANAFNQSLERAKAFQPIFSGRGIERVNAEALDASWFRDSRVIGLPI